MIEPIARLVGQLAHLPGVGRKSALRLAFYVLERPEEEARQLAEAILSAKQLVRSCAQCGNYAMEELCDICKDPHRDPSTLCVVRDARDIYAMERMREYRGLYHVLGGSISPMEGVGPDDIRIEELLDRLDGLEEIILATNPDIEGEATASYIARILGGKGLRITRIAHGVPVGGDLEYADEATLARAMQGRTLMDDGEGGSA